MANINPYYRRFYASVGAVFGLSYGLAFVAIISRSETLLIAAMVGGVFALYAYLNKDIRERLEPTG